MSPPETMCRKKLQVSGVVQGVGFRPFVYRLAQECSLAGWVKNTSSFVEIVVEGPYPTLESFVRLLHTQAPSLARIDSLTALEEEPAGLEGFSILESLHLSDTESMIPADVSTCRDCFQEIADPEDRRYGYPFTNCTNCGPRFTIVREVPYDRAHTTMSVFPMCGDCREEYLDPMDRRFHAEPTACPACGPRVWLEQDGLSQRHQVLETAGRFLREGKIVAIKGLGGFHLAADARNAQAVQTLRERKGRVAKPFAVMVRDLAEARRLCRIGDLEASLLLSPERPIVLALKLETCEAAPQTAPGNKYLGLLLPYTPLHFLLLSHAPPALVMTSGNLSEEPLVFDNDAARSKLGSLADAFLLHDRDIQVPCDDSVVRPVSFGQVIPIRRARGFVPNSIPLPLSSEPILGVGAEQKNTFCLAWKGNAVLSQHIGDLDTVETFDYYQLAIAHFQRLCRKTPAVIAYDLHPHYLSARYALQQTGMKLIGVQHHHAHIAACLAENGRLERCLGLALDGTGYGLDGTIWGGEILAADLADFKRVGHFAQIPLLGGEAAVRDPRRLAAAFLRAAFGEHWEAVAARLDLTFTPLERQVLRRQLETGLNSPLTSSAGRLFDAVAAALGICRTRTYEGQPALELEMAAHPEEDGFYAAAFQSLGDPLILDTPALFRAAVADYLSGTTSARIAARFHHSLAHLLAQACVHLRERTGLGLVALSGGVFQNALLLINLQKLLKEQGFEVLTHKLAPPNDGCISLGQVAVAAARLARTS